MRTLITIALTLFFVIDALGNIPVYLSMLKTVERKRRHLVAMREMVFALGIMLFFHYLGQWLLPTLHVTPNTVKISGGIILFLIGIRLIFPPDRPGPSWGESAPFIVPIATPLIAGPSVLAVIMIFATEQPNDWPVVGAILLAWAVSAAIFLCAQPIYKVIREKGLLAMQRLMGMIVGLIAVQMLLEGVKTLLL